MKRVVVHVSRWVEIKMRGVRSTWSRGVRRDGGGEHHTSGILFFFFVRDFRGFGDWGFGFVGEKRSDVTPSCGGSSSSPPPSTSRRHRVSSEMSIRRMS